MALLGHRRRRREASLTAASTASRLRRTGPPHPGRCSQPGKLNDIWKVEPDVSKLSPDARMPLDALTRKAIEACTKAGKWEPAKG